MCLQTMRNRVMDTHNFWPTRVSVDHLFFLLGPTGHGRLQAMAQLGRSLDYDSQHRT